MCFFFISIFLFLFLFIYFLTEISNARLRHDDLRPVRDANLLIYSHRPLLFLCPTYFLLFILVTRISTSPSSSSFFLFFFLMHHRSPDFSFLLIFFFICVGKFVMYSCSCWARVCPVRRHRVVPETLRKSQSELRRFELI